MEDLKALRHTTEHVLTEAMIKLYPGLKMAMGPATDEGFYFDFDPSTSSGQVYKISEADFAKIEAEMQKIVDSNLPLKRKEIDVEEAKKLFAGNEYKEEWLAEIESRNEKPTVYWTADEFVDLCAGPHVESTGKIGAFKLLSVAGAYWRGSEKNKMLTRIYGTAFATKKELDEYLNNIEEAKKRDHKTIGKELGIYMFSEEVGPGLPLYPPSGGVIIEEIETFMNQLQKELGYEHVYTPNITKETLFQTSGHLQWFKDGMYPPMEFEGEGKYYAKPMNCPFHIEIYKNEMRSYRDLPIRYAEFGTVYRYEKSGELAGLRRTRGFTQDDAHIFCREDQVIEEFHRVFDLTGRLLKGLGLTNYTYRLSLPGTEREKYAGNKEQWDKAIELIREAVKLRNIPAEEAEGEAAFYGPKLDILFIDSLGRELQISTIQVDFLLPERFNLAYIDSDGKEKQPYMIHRAPLGSRERILAVLLEHYMGAFPVWLQPTQVVVIPISERHIEYANNIATTLPTEGSKGQQFRIKVDSRNETLQSRIRDAQLKKIPYMLIVGDKEVESNTISVRLRTGEESKNVPIQDFRERLEKVILTKSSEL